MVGSGTSPREMRGLGVCAKTPNAPPVFDSVFSVRGAAYLVLVCISSSVARECFITHNTCVLAELVSTVPLILLLEAASLSDPDAL